MDRKGVAPFTRTLQEFFATTVHDGPYYGNKNRTCLFTWT